MADRFRELPGSVLLIQFIQFAHPIHLFPMGVTSHLNTKPRGKKKKITLDDDL